MEKETRIAFRLETKEKQSITAKAKKCGWKVKRIKAIIGITDFLCPECAEEEKKKRKVSRSEAQDKVD